MTSEIGRRSFMAGLGATAGAAFTSAGAISGGEAVVPSYRTAIDLKQALALRKVSARELLDAAIARIEALDPKINAVVMRDFERARVNASAADTALARGEQRPLLGLPITVKEQLTSPACRRAGDT